MTRLSNISKTSNKQAPLSQLSNYSKITPNGGKKKIMANKVNDSSSKTIDYE